MPRSISVFFVLALLCCEPVFSQSTYTIHPESSLTVDGTSNKSDWTVRAEQFSGRITVHDGNPVSAELVVPVMQMKGGKSLIMDRLMRNALKAEEYPQITFKSGSVESLETGGWNVTGDLTISGQTEDVAIFVQRSESGAFFGDVELAMSDFGVKPPVAMFGALRTADEITVSFSVLPESDGEN